MAFAPGPAAFACVGPRHTHATRFRRGPGGARGDQTSEPATGPGQNSRLRLRRHPRPAATQLAVPRLHRCRHPKLQPSSAFYPADSHNPAGPAPPTSEPPCRGLWTRRLRCRLGRLPVSPTARCWPPSPASSWSRSESRPRTTLPPTFPTRPSLLPQRPGHAHPHHRLHAPGCGRPGTVVQISCPTRTPGTASPSSRVAPPSAPWAASLNKNARAAGCVLAELPTRPGPSSLTASWAPLHVLASSRSRPGCTKAARPGARCPVCPRAGSFQNSPGEPTFPDSTTAPLSPPVAPCPPWSSQPSPPPGPTPPRSPARPAASRQGVASPSPSRPLSLRAHPLDAIRPRAGPGCPALCPSHQLTPPL